MAEGQPIYALSYAEENLPQFPRVINVLKSAVVAGTTSDPNWAGALYDHAEMAGGFIESMRAVSVFEALTPSMRRAPINSSLTMVTARPHAATSAEGAWRPVSKLQLANASLGLRTSSCIVAATNELLRLSDAKDLLGREMRVGLANAVDLEFLSVISDSAPNHASSGSSAANVYTDIGTLLADVAVTGAEKLFLIVSAPVAARLSIKTTTDGLRAFPGMRPNGGEISGIPVLVSNAQEEDTAGDKVTLIDADAIVYGDGGLVMNAGAAASLQLSDSPSAGAQDVVSMFQTSSVALRLVRYWNAERVRSSGVSVLTSVNWGAA